MRIHAEMQIQDEINAALYGKRKGAHPAKAAPEKRTVLVEGKPVLCDSIPEAKRYAELLLLERAGAIGGLEYHPKWELVVGGCHIAWFTADFRYRHLVWNTITGCPPPVVEDVKAGRKSKKTGKMLPIVDREFGLKCKLLKALYGINVEVVML